MKPRKILKEISMTDNGPVENTITVSSNNLSDFITCNVCYDRLKVTLAVPPCLHRFCEECINKHLMTSHNCPNCRQPVSSRRNCRKDPNYDNLVEILSRSISRDQSQSKDEIVAAARMAHKKAVERMQLMQKERKFQQEIINSSRSMSNDSMLGKRSHPGDTIIHVKFILRPYTILNSSNNDEDNLKKPYLRAPAEVSITDLTNFLKTKPQFNRTDFDILIKYHDHMITLNDDITLKDICIKYYKDADSELVLYFRRKL
jgi:hypothetical protein